MTKGLDYYKGLQYRVEIRKNGGSFSLCIPELRVFAEDASLDAAYGRLQAEKEEYFTRLLDAGYGDYIVEPEMRKAPLSISRSGHFEGMPGFFIKLMITIIAVLIVTAVLFDWAKDRVMSELAASDAYMMMKEPQRFAYHKIKDINIRLTDMPEDQREAIKTGIRDALNTGKPFIDEFMVFFSQYRDEICNKSAAGASTGKKQIAKK